MKGCECFKIALVAVALVTERHEVLVVVSVVTQRTWVIELEYVVPRVAHIATHIACVVVLGQDLVALDLAYLLALVLTSAITIWCVKLARDSPR